MKDIFIKFLFPFYRAHSLLVSGKKHVLMFHRICADKGADSLQLNVELFRELLIYILGHGEIVGIDDLFINTEKNSAVNKYVLTLDDGYEDNHSLLFPVLKEFNVSATIFLATGGVNRGYLDFDMVQWTLRKSSGKEFAHPLSGISIKPFDPDEYLSVSREVIKSLKTISHSARVSFVEDLVSHYSPPPLNRCMLTWDQIREMSNSGLVSFGAHTVNHPIISKLTRSEALFEIESSKQDIYDNTGFYPKYFAYPNGKSCDYNDETVSLLRETNYCGAFTTVPGFYEDAVDEFNVPRIDVTSDSITSRNGRFNGEKFSVLSSSLWRYIKQFRDRLS